MSKIIQSARVQFNSEVMGTFSVESFNLHQWSRNYYGNVNSSRRNLLAFVTQQSNLDEFSGVDECDEMTLMGLAIVFSLTIYDYNEYAASKTDEEVNEIIDLIFGKHVNLGG